MKYTRSRDGEYRVNLHATMRVTREEVAEIRKWWKASGCKTLKDFLDYCLRVGYWQESNDENTHLSEEI